MALPPDKPARLAAQATPLDRTLWGFPTQAIRAGGFTLLELLLVLVIIGLAVSLSAPLLIDGYARHQGRLELGSLKDLIHQIEMHTYAQSRPARLELAGHEVKLFWQEDPPREIHAHSYEHLFFEPQTMGFNAHGFVDPEQLTVTVNGEEEALSFRPTPLLNRP
ncbi:MAG: prepilin-type N-terminal cleavage/methylation domain-containing protein [Magnetococcales bacterium]|nr:prepilin-type N-terminal cleavage/methylation domain-containing protein [Magnetococcales bacterium]